MVVAALGEMPEVVDHAGRNEEAPFVVDRHAPRVARPFAPDLELPRDRVNAKQGAGELPAGMILLVVWVRLAVLHIALVEDAVEPIEPAVGPPGERIRKLVR